MLVLVLVLAGYREYKRVFLGTCQSLLSSIVQTLRCDNK